MNIFDDMPCTPVHNSIQHNRYCSLSTGFGDFYAEAYSTNTIGDNLRSDACASDDDVVASGKLARGFN